MPKEQEPKYAPGQELTLHPDDPVRGAELMKQDAPARKSAKGTDREPNTADLADIAPRIYYT